MLTPPSPPAQAPRRRPLRRVAFRAAAVLLSLGLTAAAAEVLARLVLPASMTAFRDASTDWEPHPRLGWVQRPNLDVNTREPGGWALRFQTNSDGLTPATATRARRAGVPRVMLFGDSTAVGRSVPPDETVTAQLATVLRAAGVEADVINAGVEGYSTDQELLRVEELVPLYRPDVVLLVVCDNDLGGIASATACGLHKPVFTLRENGSLEEHPPAANAAILYDGRSGAGRWLNRSALYRALRPRLALLRARFGRWEDRSLAGLDNDLYYRPDEMARVDWKLFTALVARMRACCARAGARLVVYGHPDVAAVWDPFVDRAIARHGLSTGQYDRRALETRLAAAAGEAGADFCPLVDRFARCQDRGPFHLLPADPHCNGAGYRVTAEALAEHLLGHGCLAGGPEAGRAAR